MGWGKRGWGAGEKGRGEGEGEGEEGGEGEGEEGGEGERVRKKLTYRQAGQGDMGTLTHT